MSSAFVLGDKLSNSMRHFRMVNSTCSISVLWRVFRRFPLRAIYEREAAADDEYSEKAAGFA